MATRYFTNNNNSGEGSLRQVALDASDGDVIEPQGFDGDVEILLEAALPTKSLTYRGSPDCRIVFNGQGTSRFMACGLASVSTAFEYCDFKNGYRETYAPFLVSASTGFTFKNCRFFDNSGRDSGFLFCSGDGNKGSFLFENCAAYDIAPCFFNASSLSTGDLSFVGCTIVGIDSVPVPLSWNAFNRDSFIFNEVDGFVDPENDDYRLFSDSPNASGCDLEGTDVLGNARTVGGAFGAYAETVDRVDGVKARACDKGVKLTWKMDDPGPVLLEKKVDGNWETLATSTSPYWATGEVGDVFRVATYVEVVAKFWQPFYRITPSAFVPPKTYTVDAWAIDPETN